MGHPALRFLASDMYIPGIAHPCAAAFAATCLLASLAGCGTSAPALPEAVSVPKGMPALPEAVTSKVALPEMALPKGLPELPAAGQPEPTGVMGKLGAMKDKALEAVGLKKPEPKTELPSVPDSALPDRSVNWRIHASPSLNITDTGESLAVVMRVYRLKSPDAFLSVPMDTFGDPIKERQALESDLLSVRELLLIPGQRHELQERLPRTTGFVGIVAQFRQPSAGRWRYAFDVAQAERTGLHIGVHACAMSVQQGEPVGVAANEARQVAVRCPANPYRPPSNRDN